MISTAEGDTLAALVGVKKLGAEFIIDESGTFVIKTITQAQVEGLTDALEAKVDKADGERLITKTEAEILESLVLNEDGSVGISGTVNANNVQGLAE